MLSRVANSLYWMVRYIERADNLSRLIEVNGQPSMQLTKSEDDHYTTTKKNMKIANSL